MELGICTFAETASPDGKTAFRRMQNLLEEIKLTEQVGLDVFAVGEHHRPDFIVSTPAVVLAAAAALTSRIRLSSAVTVLSSDDPVRVFQEFATVDLISGGRVEIMAGRGSFIESFPLFGYNLADYDSLFAEKLEMLLKLSEEEKISWHGKYRTALNNAGIYPRPLQDKLPVWVAVGGTPESVIRAARFGLPVALAIIGGSPDNFIQLVQLYREQYLGFGHPSENFRLCINSHSYISENSQQAADEFYPSYATMMNRIGRERGWSGMSREQFELLRGPKGALLVGSPSEVIDKILYEHSIFKNTRFLAQMSVGPMPHEKVMKSIELFGTVVAPAVRKALKN